MFAALFFSLLSFNAEARFGQANVPATPAYFLGVPSEELQLNVKELQAYREGSVKEGHWSGYYWPNYVGGLAQRRHDRSFPNSWGRAFRYSQSRPANLVELDILSPSEKYDIVMGISPEESESLTTKQWNLGKREFETTGKVAIWQGICNGWAAAAITFPKPQHPVVVPSSRGDITFTPDDIEALGSLLWAKGQFESVYVGRRCYREESTLDRGFWGGRDLVWEVDRGGRLQECFDTNPADWHILVTHMIGMRQEPFIIDYVNSNEVWNKPVIGYSYRFFDPSNPRSVSSNFANAVLDARHISLGRRYRALGTVKVVGVKMNVSLLFGTENEEASHQTTRNVEYSYLLELDRNNKIIGGEWTSEKYPDFAWKPRHAGLPTTVGDSLVEALDPASAGLSSEWRAGATAANANGAPLPRFVKHLFDQSILP